MTAVLSQRRLQILLATVGLVLFLPSLFLRDVWKPDEPRYAQVSREMVDTGEWVVPHLNGETYAHKPPLIFWIAAALRTVGLDANGGRLVSMLAGIGTMLLTAALALRWFTATTALFAALILATSLEFGWMARNGGLDIPLTFLTTLGIWAYITGGRALVLLYVAAGLSVLVKGPVGLLFMLFGIVALRIGRAPIEPRTSRHAVWGIPLMLAIIAAWVVPACIIGGEAYTNELLFKQTVGRAVKSWSHQRPFFYYILHAPEMFLPWSFVAIPAIHQAWKRRKDDRALASLMLWCALGFVIFSAISGKRPRYLLPLFPALALVVARGFEVGYWAASESEVAVWLRRTVRWQLVFLRVAAVGMAIFAIGGRWALDLLAEKKPIIAEELAWVWQSGWSWIMLATAIVVGASTIPATKAAKTNRTQRACAVLLISVCLTWIGGDVALLPVMNRQKSPRAITGRLDREFPAGNEKADDLRFAFHFHHGAYSIYSERRVIGILKEPAEILDFLRGGVHRGVVVAEKDFYRSRGRESDQSLSAALAESFPVWTLGRVGSSVMLLVSNFEPSPELRAKRTKLRK